MGNRVWTNENLKPIHVTGHLRGTSWHNAFTIAGAHLFKPVLDRSDWIRSGPYSRIKEYNAVVCKTHGLSESGFKKFADKANLQLNYVARCVIYAVIVAQLWVIGSQKILVEVEPNVGLSLE